MHLHYTGGGSLSPRAHTTSNGTGITVFREEGGLYKIVINPPTEMYGEVSYLSG